MWWSKNPYGNKYDGGRAPIKFRVMIPITKVINLFRRRKCYERKNHRS